MKVERSDNMLDTISLISTEKPIVKYRDMYIYQIDSWNKTLYHVSVNGEYIYKSEKLSDCINYILERE